MLKDKLKLDKRTFEENAEFAVKTGKIVAWMILILMLFQTFSDIEIYYRFGKPERVFNHLLKNNLIQAVMATLMLISIYISSSVIRHAVRQSQEAKDKAELEFTTDKVTGLKNRHKFEDTWLNPQNKKDTTGKAIVMLDLDHFKQVNDTYGHDVGDEVLSEFADLLLQRETASFIPYRLGGEEFVVVADEEELDTKVIALLQDWAKVVHIGSDGTPFHKTASAGVAPIKRGRLSVAMKRADAYLYLAKDRGRNQMVGECNSASCGNSNQA